MEDTPTGGWLVRFVLQSQMASKGPWPCLQRAYLGVWRQGFADAGATLPYSRTWLNAGIRMVLVQLDEEVLCIVSKELTNRIRGC